MRTMTDRIAQCQATLLVTEFKADRIVDSRPYGGGRCWTFDIGNGKEFSVISDGNGTPTLPFEYAIFDANNDIEKIEGWKSNAAIIGILLELKG